MIDEETTYIQLTLFYRELCEEIIESKLDKDGDMRFKYMSTEQHAETAADADRETATERRIRHG